MAETTEPFPLELPLGGEASSAVDDHASSPFALAMGVVVEGAGAASDATALRRKRKQGCDSEDYAAAVPSAAAAGADGAEEALQGLSADAWKKQKRQEEKRRRAHMMSRSRDLYQQALHARHQRAVDAAQMEQQQIEQQQIEQQQIEQQQAEQQRVEQQQLLARQPMALEGLMPSQQHRGISSNAILVVTKVHPVSLTARMSASHHLC